MLQSRDFLIAVFLFENMFAYKIVCLFISSTVQHIRAKVLSESLQQFGATIDGKSDMEGLTEIAVGARGHVVLLR